MELFDSVKQHQGVSPNLRVSALAPLESLKSLRYKKALQHSFY